MNKNFHILTSIISTIALLCAVSNTFGQNESYNFDSDTVGNVPAGWSVILTAGDNKVRNDRSFSAPNSLHIVDNLHESSTWLAKELSSVQYPPMTLEFQCYKASDNTGPAFAIAKSEGAYEQHIFSFFTSNGQLGYYSSGENYLGPLSSNTWHRIMIAVNSFTDANVYVDGELLGTASNQKTATEITHIQIGASGTPSPNHADAYFDDIKVYYGVSLAVTLSSFTASASTDGATLKWRTETEVDNAGFGVHRSTKPDGPFTEQIFIASTGNSGMPRDYQWMDTRVKPGQTYYYYLEDIDIAGEKNKSEVIRVVVPPAKPVLSSIPGKFRLLQNFPNPFNPETWIPFHLAARADVSIRIYDATGRIVRSLELGSLPTGFYVSKDRAVYWNGKSDLGERLSSGLYFYTFKAGDYSATRRLLIMK